MKVQALQASTSVRAPAPRVLSQAVFIACLALGLGSGAPSARAQASQNIAHYDIPAGPLDAALNHFAAQAGVLLTIDGKLTAGKTSPGLNGSASVEEGFRRLLNGTGLEAIKGDKGFGLKKLPEAVKTGETVLATVHVTAEGENAWGPVKGYLAKRSATGTKTDTPIIETPQSISVVTADFIEAIGATTLKEALTYTSGIDIAPYGSDSRFDWITVRGFDASAPGFYMDGLPLRNNGTWGIWQTENYGLERIEVLRGPASVLYGQNGPGGMVSLVSKRPTLEPLHEIQAQFGNDARRQIAGDFSGAVDEQGTVLYRLTGLARNAEMPAGHMADDRLYLAPSLTLRPSSDTTLTLLSHFLRSRAGVYVRSFPEVGSLVPTPTGGYVPNTAFAGDPGFDRLNQDQWSLGYLLEHRIDDRWTVRQNARYAHLDVDYWQVSGNGSYVTVNPGDPTDPANYRQVNRTVSGSREKVTSFTLDNQAQADLQSGDWRHTVLFGLDYQRSRFDQKSYWDSAPAIDLYAPNNGQSIAIPAPYIDAATLLTQTGLYLQDQVKWGDWIAVLGGRHDSAVIDTNDHLANATTQQSDRKFTRRAGLLHVGPDGLAPYASYSESFSPTTTIDPGTGKPFKPETGRQYEIGVRYQPPGRADRYSVAVFDLRRQNYVTTDISNVSRQAGEITVRGLELEAAIQPVSRLNLIAAYTLTPTADVTASNNPAEIGKQMTATPRHRLSLWGDYRFVSGLKLGLGARYVGTTRGNGETAVTDVPAYTVLDALVGYDLDRWSLALNLRNLTDKTYLTNCGYGSCYYGEPRKAMATVTYRW